MILILITIVFLVQNSDIKQQENGETERTTEKACLWVHGCPVTWRADKKGILGVAVACIDHSILGICSNSQRRKARTFLSLRAILIKEILWRSLSKIPDMA